jgi:GNAT superfamily N-acetyltransferase
LPLSRGSKANPLGAFACVPSDATVTLLTYEHPLATRTSAEAPINHRAAPENVMVPTLRPRSRREPRPSAPHHPAVCEVSVPTRAVTCWTAEVQGVRNRPAGPEDVAFLATMLGEAAVWRPDKPTPTGGEVLADPRYAQYLAGWPRPGDFGLVAEHDGPVGAAWYRMFTEADHGHGFVAEDVPELAIAVIAARRREGIGRRLLVDLIDAGRARGHPALSLSVGEANPARRLYASVGFVHVGRHGSTWTMIRPATRSR